MLEITKQIEKCDLQHRINNDIHRMSDFIIANGKGPHQDEFVPFQLSCPVRLRAVTINKGLPAGHLVLCLPCGQAL